MCLYSCIIKDFWASKNILTSFLVLVGMISVSEGSKNSSAWAKPRYVNNEAYRSCLETLLHYASRKNAARNLRSYLNIDPVLTWLINKNSSIF